jgi:hypothetical protein
MADTLTAAPTCAGLRQAGVANPPTIIVSPNTTATLVVSAPAVVIARHPVQVEGQKETRAARSVSRRVDVRRRRLHGRLGGAGRRLVDPVGVTIPAVRRQA